MITRRKLLKLSLASLVVPALRSTAARSAFSPAHAPQARAGMAEAARPCPTLVLDGGLAYSNRTWTQGADLLDGLRAVQPQALGYPGHHQADYWDWQTGWVDAPRMQVGLALPPDIESLVKRTGCLDLNALKVACAAAGAPVLFTANLLTRSRLLTAPGSGDPLADAAEGKAFLQNGLRACAALGISVRWLVLGDSLAGEQPWRFSFSNRVFRGDTSSGATDYPLIAADWAAAARQEFPNLAVAACAAGSMLDADLCVTQWNARLVQQFAGKPNPCALAFSLNLPGGLGVSSGTASGWGLAAEQKQQYSVLRDQGKEENRQRLRALFLQPPAALQAWLDQPLGNGQTPRGSGLRFWLNAVHLADPVGALRYTWAHGLLLANALQSALREPLIDLAVLHNSADPYHAAFFYRPRHFADLLLGDEDGIDITLLNESARLGDRTALGHVFTLFFAAARGAATARPLSLDPPGDPLVWGWAFSTETARLRSVLLGNLTETAQEVDLSDVWAAAGGVLEGQIYQALPCEYITRASSQPGVPFALQVSRAETETASPLRLPPYSLALLSGLRVQNPVYLPLIQKYN